MTESKESSNLEVTNTSINPQSESVSITTTVELTNKRALSPVDNDVAKKAKPSKKEQSTKPEYKLENQLRYVEPYNYKYETYVKGRWIGRTILNVFQTEFLDKSPEYYEQAIVDGKITVNGQKVELDRKLKNAEIVAHQIHRHEPPVTSQKLRILSTTNSLIIVDKPSSIPVHPSGRYHFNTLKHILETDHGIDKFYAINRLDRLTSGIVMVARDNRTAHRMEELMKGRHVQKLYISKVAGKFPSTVSCTEPIKTVNFKLGLNEVHPEGKPCETQFHTIRYDETENTSLLLCVPKTGRTHQIRVHLRHLGFPIIDDPLYNEDYKQKLEGMKAELPPTKGQCTVCNWDILRDPEQWELGLCLHAFEYKVEDQVYTSNTLPSWAKNLTLDEIKAIDISESSNDDTPTND